MALVSLKVTTEFCYSPLMVQLFQVVLAPPLYRHRPRWYQTNLAAVAGRFSSTFGPNQPDNFHLLPSFACQDLAPDGVHLAPVSGLHYMLHLFDQTETQVALVLTGTGPQQFASVFEAVRHQNDRLSYLESRHGHLERRVDIKTAIDSEFSDWQLNRSEEDWIVVAGLPRLPENSDRWQDAAKKQVTEAIHLILKANRARFDFKVVYVGNPFRYQNHRSTLYNVRMDSVSSSERIRDLNSGFHRAIRPVPRPPGLKDVSFRNKVTKETKIRIAILRQLGNIFKDQNQGGSFKVRGFESRPLLMLVPARGSSTKQRTYNFIQAVSTLPASFTDEHLIRIYSVVGNSNQGCLQDLFVVLNDDTHQDCLALVQQSRSQGAPPVAPALSFSGAVTGSGSGMDLNQARVLASLTSPPPPPPLPAQESPHHSKFDQLSKAPKSSRSERSEKSVRFEDSESDSAKRDKSDKTDRSDRSDRSDRPESDITKRDKSVKTDRSDRSDRSNRSDRSSKSEKSRHEKTGKSSRSKQGRKRRHPSSSEEDSKKRRKSHRKSSRRSPSSSSSASSTSAASASGSSSSGSESDSSYSRRK